MVEKQQQAKILFVEDSKNEFLLNSMILRRENVEVDMDHVRDVVEALDYLKGRKKHRKVTRLPDLILLDQRLVTMDDDQLLKKIEKEKLFKNIPVVMFSGMNSKEEQESAPGLNTIAFFDKPVNLDKLTQVVHKIKKLFFKTSGNKKCLCVK